MKLNLPFYLSPLSFLEMKVEIHYLPINEKPSKKHLLPCFHELLEEENQGACYMGWNEKELSFLFSVEKQFESATLSEYKKHDSIELFIDSRDNKSKTVISQFCHHFVFIPTIDGGGLGKEITRFRSDDVHKLCDSALLQVGAKFLKNSYELHITIPAECLYGYDPKRINHLGFSYQINLFGKEPIHFNVSSKEFSLERSPTLWASVFFSK